MELTAEQKTAYHEARQKALKIVQDAEAAGKELTEGEKAELSRHLGECQSIQQAAGIQGVVDPVTLEQIKASGALDPDGGAARRAAAATRAAAAGGEQTGGVKVYDPASGEHPWTKAFHTYEAATGQKALTMPTGAVPLLPLSDTPVSLGQPGGELLALIGIAQWPEAGGRAIPYLRQKTRVNNAALWRHGSGEAGADEAKPESVYELEQKVAEAQTVAHTASPIRREWLADYPSLNAWLGGEMVTGLRMALEDAILNAVEEVEGIPGLLSVEGTQPIGFDTDAPTTISHALTALQKLGYADNLVVVLSPDDGEALALLKSSQTGEFLFPSAPAGGAAPTVFGARKVIAPALDAGIAIVGQLAGNLRIYERETPTLFWGTTSGQFERNNVTALAEGRFAVELGRPPAVAVVDLSGGSSSS